MRDYNKRCLKEDKTRLLTRKTKLQEDSSNERHFNLNRSAKHNFLPPVASRLSSSTVEGHAFIFNRTLDSGPSTSRDFLINLQRNYGKRYVQQVLNLNFVAGEKAGCTPELRQTDQQTHVSGEISGSHVQNKMTSSSGVKPLKGVNVVQLAPMKIGQPGDEYKHEAEKIAQRLVSDMNIGKPPHVKCQEIPPEDAEIIRMKVLMKKGFSDGDMSPPELDASINLAKAFGQPLPEKI